MNTFIKDVATATPCEWTLYIIGRSKGGHQGRVPPEGPNSFIFMQFSGTKLKNNSTFGSWRTPWGKSWIRHCI